MLFLIDYTSLVHYVYTRERSLIYDSVSYYNTWEIIRLRSDIIVSDNTFWLMRMRHIRVHEKILQFYDQ